MRNFGTAISTMTAAFALLASAASASTTLNVNWNEGCGKATCFNDAGVYKQTWSAGDFKGPISIGQVLMQRGVLGSLGALTFKVDFLLNGKSVSTWGSYNMSGINGEQLGLWGEEFTWNPEDGDLVLQLAFVPAPKPGAGGGGGGGGGLGRFSAPEEPGEGGKGGPSENTPPETPPFPLVSGDDLDMVVPNIVTEEDGPGQPPPGRITAAVPEPATWAMMIGGFGMAGASLRRRRLAVASVQPKR